MTSAQILHRGHILGIQLQRGCDDADEYASAWVAISMYHAIRPSWKPPQQAQPKISRFQSWTQSTAWKMAWMLESETLRHAPAVRVSCVSSCTAEKHGVTSPRLWEVPQDAVCQLRPPEAADGLATHKLQVQRSVFEGEHRVNYRSEELKQSWD